MHVKFGGHASMMPGRVRTLNPVRPPSTTTVWPVINALSSLVRKQTVPVISPAVPTRLMACSAHYLRNVRLDGARSDLISGDEATTVSDVAYRWGFNHLGRFAAHYEHKFGETPSRTLRRR
jgi:AraC-like DNA-binding protein